MTSLLGPFNRLQIPLCHLKSDFAVKKVVEFLLEKACQKHKQYCMKQMLALGKEEEQH